MFSTASISIRGGQVSFSAFIGLALLICFWRDSPSLAAEQVSQLQARHSGGQTILTWRELHAPVVQEALTIEDLQKLRTNLDQGKRVRYHIYRAKQPITSTKDLQSIAEVPPLTAWNADYYGIQPKAGSQALRYVIAEGQPPVASGTGIYAHNPADGGNAFYAVTVSINGQENVTIGTGNTLQAALHEMVGEGYPILQRVEKPASFQYIEGPTLYYYVRWEAPPNSSNPSQPFDYLVGVPSNVAKPAPVGIHLHAWGGNLNEGYGWWYNADKGAILIASNQIPYDWWTGYHELFWAKKSSVSEADWRKGIVRAYSQRRMLSFLDWVATKWDVDPNRVFAAGNSMGGSGASKLAIRYPNRIAWAVAWVASHIPRQTPQFIDSFASVYGRPEWKVPFEDGTLVWDHFDDVWYLRRYPARETGFIAFSNGKNDSAIGWPQAVEFYLALQDTKRPHLFVWGQDGHGQRPFLPNAGGERVMPIDIRVNQSLPAFTRCSLDDNPGNGAPNDGDPFGQINLYLYWETQNIIDMSERWEITVGLINAAPRDDSSVDVTPRRLQVFRASPGERFRWVNTSIEKKKVLQSGEVTADKWGFVTMQNVIVDKGKNRLKLIR